MEAVRPFQQGPSEPLDKTADELALDQHWINGSTHIVHHQIALDLHFASLAVDAYLGEMNTIRKGHMVGIEPTLCRQAGRVPDNYSFIGPHGTRDLIQADHRTFFISNPHDLTIADR
jgi:hypothetical protein